MTHQPSGVLAWVAVLLTQTSSGVAEDARVLKLRERHPNRSEVEVCGALERVVQRDSTAFKDLVQCDDSRMVFKDEEKTGADRMATPRLRDGLKRLAQLVNDEWPGLKLRITEAWDEDREHGTKSLHYEARAADLTTSDRDARKLGRLARLAVDAGLDWVFYEDELHVHVSVKK